MKNLFTNIAPLIILTLFSIGAIAQSQRDILYLKNGSIIKGIVTEILPDSTLTFETADGSVFVYKLKEVKKTAKEVVEKSVNTESKTIAKYDNITPIGYFILARFGPNERLTEDDVTDISGGLITGFNINKYFSLGLGVEATRYTFNNTQDKVKFSIPVYPVFIDARFHVNKTRVNPMFSLQFGYSLIDHSKVPPSKLNSTGKLENKGVYMSAGGGIRALINKTFSILAEAAVSFQTIDGYNDYYNYYNKNYTVAGDNRRIVPSLRLNIGLCINLGSIESKSNY